MRKITWIAASLVICSAAGGSGMPNPLVRVPLRHRLPKEIKGRLPSAIELDCNERKTLQAEGVSHDVMINWRVLDVDGVRYIIAVDVQPSGSIKGGSSPTGSAAVGKLSRLKAGKKTVDEVPIYINFSAQKGCGSVKTNITYKARSDHKSCKSSAPKNLLKP